MREKRQTKFVTPEEAVQAVRNGDWVDYGFGAGFPELLDRALDICTITERKKVVTTQKEDASAEEFTTYLLETIDRLNGDSHDAPQTDTPGRIAVGVGYTFTLVPIAETEGINLKESGNIVAVDGQEYPLMKGTAFEDSRKVDALLDALAEGAARFRRMTGR